VGAGFGRLRSNAASIAPRPVVSGLDSTRKSESFFARPASVVSRRDLDMSESRISIDSRMESLVAFGRVGGMLAPGLYRITPGSAVRI
jgi:hypothetical protein